MLLAAPLLAQGPAHLLRDLNTTPQAQPWNGFPKDLVVAGAQMFFTADLPQTGRELWVTDGTLAGTRLVGDLLPGPVSSQPDQLTALGTRVVFRATHPAYGRELWTSDGTSSGTRDLRDIEPMGANSDPEGVTVLNGTAYFAAFRSGRGLELWRTDGTPGGTSSLAAFTPILASGPKFAVLGGALFFAAAAGGLWRTDGTAAGTIQVLGNSLTVSGTLANTSTLVFLRAFDQISSGLWCSDGTSAGSRRVGPYPNDLGNATAVGPALFFTNTDRYGTELWRSDGTVAGTGMVRDINAQTLGSSYPFGLTDAGGFLLFSADDGVSGRELWRSDGTAAGTVRFLDIEPGLLSSDPGPFLRWNGWTWFGAHFVNARRLWRTDGTQFGTTLVATSAELMQVPNQQLTPFQGRLWLDAYAPNTGIELWRSDGTAAGTVLFADLGLRAPASAPAQMVVDPSGARAWFVADDGVHGRELWTTDGTATGTFLVADQTPGAGDTQFADLVPAAGRLFFTTGSPPRLYAADPVPGAVQPVGGSLVVRSNLGLLGNSLIFGADTGVANTTEPWSCDVASLTCTLVQDLVPGTQGSYPRAFTPVSGTMFFWASNGVYQNELWHTDGTGPGTARVAQVDPNPRLNGPYFTAVAGGRLVFAQQSTVSGDVLWSADATGAQQLRGFADAHLIGVGTPAEWRGEVYFVAYDVPTGQELWKTDGTAAGTVLVSDMAPGQGDSSPRMLTPTEDCLLFNASVNGNRALWRTDGTAAGTQVVMDFLTETGTALAQDQGFQIAIPATRSALLAVADLGHGVELWITDGTRFGTRRFQELAPGPASADLGRPVVFGARLLFAADDGTHGIEPWILDVANAERFGQGCAGSSGRAPRLEPLGGAPTLGNALFALAVQDARPGSFAVLAIARQRQDVALGSGCLWQLDPVRMAIVATAPVDAAARALLPFPIPFDPQLAGASLFAQALVPDPGAALLGQLAVSSAVAIRCAWQ